MAPSSSAGAPLTSDPITSPVDPCAACSLPHSPLHNPFSTQQLDHRLKAGEDYVSFLLKPSPWFPIKLGEKQPSSSHGLPGPAGRLPAPTRPRPSSPGPRTKPHTPHTYYTHTHHIHTTHTPHTPHILHTHHTHTLYSHHIHTTHTTHTHYTRPHTHYTDTTHTPDTYQTHNTYTHHTCHTHSRHHTHHTHHTQHTRNTHHTHTTRTTHAYRMGFFAGTALRHHDFGRVRSILRRAETGSWNFLPGRITSLSVCRQWDLRAGKGLLRL